MRRPFRSSSWISIRRSTSLGPASGSASAHPCRRAIGSTTKKKMAAAMVAKLISVLRKLPIFISDEPTITTHVEKSGSRRCPAGGDDVLDERGHDRAECGTDHHRNREVDDVASEEERPELLDHVSPRTRLGRVRGILLSM